LPMTPPPPLSLKLSSIANLEHAAEPYGAYSLERTAEPYVVDLFQKILQNFVSKENLIREVFPFVFCVCLSVFVFLSLSLSVSLSFLWRLFFIRIFRKVTAPPFNQVKLRESESSSDDPKIARNYKSEAEREGGRQSGGC
jgi:hypothetical protein